MVIECVRGIKIYFLGFGFRILGFVFLRIVYFRIENER